VQVGEKNPQHSLLFGLENEKEIPGDDRVARAVLDPSPSRCSSAGKEVRAAEVPKPPHSSAAGAPRLPRDLSQRALGMYLT